ncbi:antibiotic biosynthesis monooxygenase family protein [Halioxenophilus aromaticivorans]|uniref:Antibiotic biosynthesis monooxygenase n=1 Tax=Halioxenophilus aromaticivorans TaxID=1306992 RepID=A0AAV3U828_9ALTE
MIYELAEIEIIPNSHIDFEKAVAEAAPYFQSAEGCLSFRLDKIAEKDNGYLLVVGWQSVRHHMELFRATDNFQQWRKLASHFFAAPPKVVHTEHVFNAF